RSPDCRPDRRGVHAAMDAALRLPGLRLSRHRRLPCDPRRRRMKLIPAPSPNFNERTAPPDMLILHYTGMPTGEAALARMRDPASEVSAHYMVETDGRVFALVPEERRAWHAGKSFWRGATDINSLSIGVE